MAGSRLFRWMPSLSSLVLLLPLVVNSCAHGNPSGAGIRYRDPAFGQVLSSGMAVAPVGHVKAVVDAAQISAFFTNELYSYLLLRLEKVPLISPEDVLSQIALHGDAGLESFRAFRRARVAGRPLDPAACTRLSQLVQHRYLLLTWVDESKKMGMEEMSHDYTSSGFALDVERVSYVQVEGSLSGEIIDLWEHQLLWRGSSSYKTPRLYGESGANKDELERCRAEGVLQFVEFLTAP